MSGAAHAGPPARGAAGVVVASTRGAQGLAVDTTGPVIAAWLVERGWQVGPVRVVADGDAVGAALRDLVAQGVEVVLTTGGTGVSPTDATPEQTAAVLDRELPGLAAAIRARGADVVPTAVLSRGLAGVAGRTVVVNLPGSPGGVRDGLAVLDDVLGHAVDQVAGGARGDHERPSDAAGLVPAPERVLRAEVVDASLTGVLDELVALVADATCGAVATFTGLVRDHDEGRGVERLRYEAHPDATAVIADVAAEVAGAHPDVRLAVVHRYGDLGIGDVAIVAAVASAHRGASFDAVEALVDEVKHRVPIWKEQFFDDGSAEWVGSLG
ncbi:molybdenum cofactor biosynthesis protein MoaE [Luteimicrobium subarcticum]|uniref:Molybdenum cofactor synthesis domain-containing protein n=1 Tax=Luteimicrobium subarcticum TaxID=620910 RepID=A0A2M8W1D7_9MICO|nr:molybdenum cofactor biosynthesis protein MoaE [Luteimicrobium subarcticum]PJI84729.1 molybdenum cofactor synthesis domain-containing protein [Luteimicrobium subarcticum]